MTTQKVKVRFEKQTVTPTHNFQPGIVYELPEDLAQKAIEAGGAPVREVAKKKRKAVKEVPDTT